MSDDATDPATRNRDYAATFRDRYGTALLADAAYRAGVALEVPRPGLTPLGAAKIAGRAVTVEANNDLVGILEGLERAAAGEVLVIANRSTEVALIGDLIATEASRKKLAGIVVDGLVRDAATLLEIGLPVFCRGVWPVGPLKLPAELKGIGRVGIEIELSGANVEPGGWVFGDGDGVLVLAESELDATYAWAEKTLEREEALTGAMRAGESLADLLGLARFLEERRDDPRADFNEHLARHRRAI